MINNREIEVLLVRRKYWLRFLPFAVALVVCANIQLDVYHETGIAKISAIGLDIVGVLLCTSCFYHLIQITAGLIKLRKK